MAKSSKTPKSRDISSIFDRSSNDKIMRGGSPPKHSPTKNGGRC